MLNFLGSSIISKTPYLEHFCMMVLLCSIEKDSIAPTWGSFKNCVLACKIWNQMHTDFEKRKVPQSVSGNFAEKWLFCKKNVLCNICSFICGQFLKNMFEVVHT